MQNLCEITRFSLNITAQSDNEERELIPQKAID